MAKATVIIQLANGTRITSTKNFYDTDIKVSANDLLVAVDQAASRTVSQLVEPLKK